ncbi:MAG: hypothetical protein FK734_19735, partial [Asgard group archaeon]|nr:hypothetical protein [Asgard group archaeon]
DGGIISELAYPVNATIGDASVIFREMSDVQPCNFSAPYDPNDADYAYRGQIGAWLGFYPPIEAISYKRKITIDNWYYAKVEEEITIECFGLRLDEVYDLIHIETLVGYGLQRFSLGIWYAENGKVHDEFGDLGKPTGAADVVQTNQINIYLRVPMIGGDVKTIYVDYNLKLEDLLEFDGTEYILSTTALPECDFFVRNFELELIFPQGSKFQYLTFGNQEVDYNTDYVFSFLKLGRRQSVDFTATNLTSYDDMSLKLGYYMNDLAIYIQPLTFMLIIFVACLLYIGVRTLRKDVIEKVIIVPEVTAEIPIELIQSFVEQYEEKTALQTRITNLDEDRRRKKIKAKEYDQQRKILESKMRELIKKLDLTKRQLKEKGRKYFDVIQKIEVSEEKRTSVERSIQDLRFRYIREKQISKDAYIRILRDYQNQIERFERDIDKEIINLRLLIEHESKEV